MGRALNALTSRWWERLPVAAGRISFSTGSMLTDGMHLTRWVPVGALAPIVGGVVGAATVVVMDGPVFTRSLLMMALLILVSFQGLPVGLGAWTGYVVADLLVEQGRGAFFRDAVERWIGAPLATLDGWLLMSLLTLVLPATLLALRVEMRRLGWAERFGSVAEKTAYVGLAALLTYLWTSAMPVLVRPVFVLVGDDPTAADVVPVQERWWVLVGAGVAGALVRLALESRSQGDPFYARLRMVTDRFRTLDPSRVPRPQVSRAVAVALTTLLLGGLVDRWWWVPLVALFLWFLLAARERLARQPIRPLSAIPLLYRWIGGAALAYLALRITIGFTRSSLRWETESFLLPLVGTCLAIAIVVLLTAPPRETPEVEE